MERLVEQFVEQPSSFRVTREARTIHDVVLLTEHSRNGYDYDREAMREALPLYEGVVIVDQHTKGSEGKRLVEKAGVVTNPRYVEVGGVAKIVGDVRAFSNEAGDTLLDLAEFAPKSAGMSHEARGEWKAAA